MRTFKEYFAMGERTYNYRIKTVTPLDDDALSKIEHVLNKYVPLDVSNVEKTIIQRNPLDFPGVDNAEVYYIDISLGLPVSSYILQQDIRYALHIPEKFIVVRAPNEPTEVETQRLNALHDIEEEAQEKGYTRRAGNLSTDSSYPEVGPADSSDIAGPVYNARLLDYLKTLEDRKETEVILTPGLSPHLFDWMKEKPAVSYNIDIQPQVKGRKPKYPHSISNQGNLDDNVKFYSAVYQNSKGKKKVISKTGEAGTKELK